MKRLSILLVLVAIAISSNAQNDYGGNGGFGQIINGDGWLRPGEGGRTGGGGNGTPGKNIIKARLDGLLTQKIGLAYERVLNPKITIGVEGLYQLPITNGSLSNDFGLFYDLITDNLSNQETTFDSIFVPSNYGFQGSEINRFFVMPEIRYYFKEAPRGLFAGLYFKYRSYDYGNKLLYTDTFSTPGTPINYDFDFNFNMNTASAGISFGLHTFFLKRISLDLVFFGIQYSSNIGSINITRNNNPLPSDIQADVQSGINYINKNLPLVEDIFRLKENNADEIIVESRFTSPSIRLPSLRLGFRF